MKWYYPPRLGADLSRGFETFQKHDDSQDEHLDSLLKTIMTHEQEKWQKIDANVVTWRGMMTKVCLATQPSRSPADSSLLTLPACRSWRLPLIRTMGIEKETIISAFTLI